jgi:hypothetical protein
MELWKYKSFVFKEATTYLLFRLNVEHSERVPRLPGRQGMLKGIGWRYEYKCRQV